MKDIVCISHLRWEFVWQRPQHLLSRFARNCRVLFVEEPLIKADPLKNTPWLETYAAPNAPGVTVVRLVVPVQGPLFGAGHGDPLYQAIYSRLLTKYLKAQHYGQPILWLYTPMALDFSTDLPHDLLIFDVMDHLAAFKGAPPQLLEREKQLLERADLVFTGGPSLYQAKQATNPVHTYEFASGVEIEHFARATGGGLARPADLPPAASGPLLGYYGVIDERMDLELLCQLAEARPQWQIAVVGPVLKIDQAELPQAPNLHYPGQKAYDELPAYLAHFEVGLVPFALNEATRYLSPTKTLEYIAAHKPVVSTPIQDVISLYGSVVKIGATSAQFIEQVEAALIEKAEVRREREDALLTRGSWDSIASRMSKLMEKRLLERHRHPAFTLLSSEYWKEAQGD